MDTSMNLSRTKQSSVLWCFPLLLSLSGCGETGPECGSADARNSVVRTVADNRNNPLLDYAAKNSDSVDEQVSHAKSEAEKTAILEKAKQDATYSLDETIVMNSRTARAAACTACRRSASISRCRSPSPCSKIAATRRGRCPMTCARGCLKN